MIDMDNNTEENLLLILPFINSKVCQYFIRVFAAPRLGNTFIETKIVHLLKLPIPVMSEKQKDEIVEIVREIINAKTIDMENDTSSYEKELEEKIYECYGLSEQEIEIIERNA